MNSKQLAMDSRKLDTGASSVFDAAPSPWCNGLDGDGDGR